MAVVKALNPGRKQQSAGSSAKHISEGQVYDVRGRERPMIQTKRVYDIPDSSDGTRFLVERLWPRGIKKVSLKMEVWAKDAAPSAELRRWFNHETAKWLEFQRRYRAELDAHPDSWKPILTEARRGPVTLLYSAHDVEHNNAVVLCEYLKARLGKR